MTRVELFENRARLLTEHARIATEEARVVRELVAVEDALAVAGHAPPSATGPILAAVLAETRLTEAELRQKTRRPDIARPRQIAQWIFRERLGWSYPRIAGWWDMDHTTIMHACRTVVEWPADSAGGVLRAAVEKRLAERTDDGVVDD